MKNELLYMFKTGEDNELELIPDADYKNIINGSDTQVDNMDGLFLLTKAEFKDDVEKRYNIKLKPFSSDFIERMISYDEIGTLMSGICSNNDMLSSYWSKHSFSDKLARKIYMETVVEIYKMPVDDAIEFIVDGNEVSELMEKSIEKFMYKHLIKELKEGLKELG